jgi:uncharacterized protein (TIGR02271 family)
MATTDEILSWRGQNLVDQDGDKVGKIEEIYLDAETNEPEWALVNTGLFGTKHTFVPLKEASAGSGGARVPYDKQQIKDAPTMDADGQLSQQEEQQLYQYYGLGYTESRSDSGLPEGGAGVGTAETVTTGTTGGRSGDPTPDGSPGVVGNDVSGPETDDAMTRSEEELTVGKTERETGRVRLRKYIVGEQVSQTVPVRHETAHVEREPITDANRDAALSGGDLTEEEHEVTLRSEEAVAQKRVVPKERVRLDKDVEVTEEQVSDTVRKEQIDVEGDTDRTDRI